MRIRLFRRTPDAVKALRATSGQHAAITRPPNYAARHRRPMFTRTPEWQGATTAWSPVAEIHDATHTGELTRIESLDSHILRPAIIVPTSVALAADVHEAFEQRIGVNGTALASIRARLRWRGEADQAPIGLAECHYRIAASKDKTMSWDAAAMNAAIEAEMAVTS